MRTVISRPAVTALLALLTAAGCGGRKGAAGIVRASDIGVFPKESVGLLVLEVKKVRAQHPDAPWLKSLAGLADRDRGPFRDLLRRLGPDLMEHLDRLSLAVVPQPEQKVGYGILAEGTFDVPKLREALGGSDFLTIVEKEGSDFSVILLKDGAVALGPKSVLGTMRDNGASRGHGLDENQPILGSLENIRPEAQFWGAVDCHGLQRLFKETSLPSDLSGLALNSEAVQSLVTLAFRGIVGQTVDLELFGQADKKESAKRLADAARGLVALGRVGAGRDQAKEWLEFLDGIRIDQSGAYVNLRASIPAKTMESFVVQMTSESPQEQEAQSPASTTVAPATASPAPPPAPSRPSPAAGGSRALPDPKPSGTQTPSAGAP